MTTDNGQTEQIRRERFAEINNSVEFQNPFTECKLLQTQWDQVWDLAQLAVGFEILGFLGPYVVVRSRCDGRKVSLEFQHRPRFYFNLVLD